MATEQPETKQKQAKPATAAPASTPARKRAAATQLAAKKPAAKAAATTGEAKIAPPLQPEKPRKVEKAQRVEKPGKARLVRDSFTMPESEYELLAQVKKRCIASGAAVKKSEVLRAALTSFAALGDAAIGKAIAALPPVKTGRPPKDAR